MLNKRRCLSPLSDCQHFWVTFTSGSCHPHFVPVVFQHQIMQSCTYETGATWFQPLKPTNTPRGRLLMLFALLMFLSPIYGSGLSSTWITRTTSQLVLTCSAFLIKHLYIYCSLKKAQIPSNYSISTPRRCSGTLNLTLGAGHYRGQEGTASCVLQLTSHFLSPQLHAPYKAKERAWLF